MSPGALSPFRKSSANRSATSVAGPSRNTRRAVLLEAHFVEARAAVKPGNGLSAWAVPSESA